MMLHPLRGAMGVPPLERVGQVLVLNFGAGVCAVRAVDADDQ